MNCRRVQPQLLDFSFDRLEAGAASVVAAHLDRCADCRRVLKRERRAASLLGAMSRVQPRADAWPAVEAALRAARTPLRARFFWQQPAVWAGGLAAAAAIVVGLTTPVPRAPAASTDAELLRALAPRVAAGLGPDHSNDPLFIMQKKMDRLLEHVADEGS